MTVIADMDLTNMITLVKAIRRVFWTARMIVYLTGAPHLPLEKNHGAFVPYIVVDPIQA